MILVQKTYFVNSNALPATWHLTSTNSCATAQELTGTTEDGNIVLNLLFNNTTCFNLADFTLVVTDNCGAVTTLSFDVANVCSGWTASISQDTDFNFQANIVGSGTFTYQWNYNTDVFETSPFDNQAGGYLSLQLLGSPTHQMELVELIVTDSVGCTQSFQHNFSLVAPVGKNSNLVMSCVEVLETNPVGVTGEVNKQSKVFTLNFTPPFSRTIDWSTLEFSNVSNIFPLHLGNGQVIIYANSTFTATSALVKARVKDSLGVWSNQISIGIIVPACFDEKPITIDENYVFAPGEATVSGVTYIPLENLVAADEEINWSTFTFVAGAGQTLVSATSLTTPFATVAVGVDRRAAYTVTTLPTTACADTIKWIVANTDGIYSRQGRIYFDYSVAAAPVTVANTTCAVCGSSQTIQPLSNDTGKIDPSSFTVTTAPTKGSYQFNNPDFTYIANNQASGTDTISYKVANPDGHFSNISNITVTVVCSGEDNALTACTSSSLDFTDYLSSWATAGGTWTQDAGNPDTVSLVDPTDVDFTGNDPGTYLFYYTVTSGGCSHEMTLTVNAVATSTNNTCANATVMSWPAQNTVSGEILPCDTDSTLETSPGAVQNPRTWNTVHSPDHWFKFTTNATVAGYITVSGIAYKSQGIVNPQIALYSSDGTPCTTDDFNYIASTAETNGAKYKQLAFEGLTASTQYWIRITSGGSTTNVGKYNLTLQGA